MKYTHLELDKEQRALAGYYVPLKEVRLDHNGRQILYMVGQVVIDAACCNAGSGFAYVIVPGYIVNWQKEKNQSGLPVSEVESITDEAARRAVRKLIRETERISHIEFW